MLSFVTRARLAAAITVPALVLGSGSAAVAAPATTLTLTALNRSGAKVTITTTVVDLATSSTYRVRTGKARKLPKGNYAVLASIRTGSTTTLGGKTVKVAGKSKLTIDARQGKRVTMALSPAAAGLENTISVRICTRTGASSNVEAGTFGGDVYVVPTTSKKLGYAALGSWTDGSGLTDSFAGLHSTTGVPAKPSRTFARSSLAAVTIDSRRGPSASNSASLAVQPTGGCGNDLYASVWSSDRPTTSKVRLSAGSWTIRHEGYAAVGNIGGHWADRKLAAGKTYSIRFGGGAWGPSEQLPTVIRGRIQYGLNEMFSDPAFSRTGYNGEGGDKATATLKFADKTVKTKKDRGWESEPSELAYTVKKAGWYTLTNTASRYYPEIAFPAGMLSTASSVTYRFKAKPKANALAPLYSVQMVPYNLDRTNRAKAKTTTNVGLPLKRTSSMDPDAKRGKNPKLKSVTAKMSADGGRTWRTVPVKKINGTWTAAVPNPAAGAVSLRARATFVGGAYTEVSIYRAYGIGQ